MFTAHIMAQASKIGNTELNIDLITYAINEKKIKYRAFQNSFNAKIILLKSHNIILIKKMTPQQPPTCIYLAFALLYSK